MESNFENLPAGTVVETNGGYLFVITSLISPLDSEFDYEVEPYPFSSINMDTCVDKVYKKYPKFKSSFLGIMKKDITRIIFLGYQGNER